MHQLAVAAADFHKWGARLGILSETEPTENVDGFQS